MKGTFKGGPRYKDLIMDQVAENVQDIYGESLEKEDQQEEAKRNKYNPEVVGAGD